MPTSTNPKTSVRCSYSFYKQSCILQSGHHSEHFAVAYFGSEMAGVYFIDHGRQWVFQMEKWPKEVLNLPWDVYEDVRNSATYRGVLRRA